MSSLVLLILSIFGLAVWAVAVFVLVFSTFASVLLHPRLRQVKLSDDIPSLALIRPIAGNDHRMAEVTASTLTQEHPDLQVIFAVSSDADPALPLIRDLHEAFPERSRIAFGEQWAEVNPKLNNMAGGLREADAEFLFFSDSNTLLDPISAKRWQAQAMACGGVISAVPEGVDPQSLAAWTECAFFIHQFRLNVTLDCLGMSSVHGKAMILSSANFEAMGGIDALRRYPNEDFAMAKAAQAAQIPARLSDVTACTPLGPRSWHAIWGRQRRWARTRALMAPESILAEFPILMVPSGIAGSLAFASLWSVEPIAFLSGHVLLWLLADFFTARMRGKAHGPWSPVATLMRELLNPVGLLAAFSNRQVEWRGNVYTTSGRKWTS